MIAHQMYRTPCLRLATPPKGRERRNESGPAAESRRAASMHPAPVRYRRPNPTKPPDVRAVVRRTVAPVYGASTIMPPPAYMATCRLPPLP